MDSFWQPFLKMKKEQNGMNIKQIETLAAIFGGCVLGSILLQFAAPILLAILVSGVSLTVPFLIYHLFVRKGWRIRLEREKNGSDAQKEEETENAWAEPEETGGPKAPEQNRVNKQEENDSESEEETAMLWYNETGRSRLDEIVQKLNSRGVTRCWIRSDGICSYRTAKGFRRIGIFYGYPGKLSALIARLMREDGLTVMEQKRYLRLSWGQEEEAA